MPYPKPDDPDYCASSRQLIPDYDKVKQWFRCPTCKRPISAMGLTRRFFPHVSNIKRARDQDRVREGLISFGLNRRDRWSAPLVVGPFTTPEEIFGPVSIPDLRKGA